MKTILIAFCAVLLFGCGAPRTNLSDLQGQWVIEAYPGEVKSELSAKKAMRNFRGFTGVCIAPAQGDSAFVTAIINNHEAITGYLHAGVSGRNPGTLLFDCHNGGDQESWEIGLETTAQGEPRLVLLTNDLEGKLLKTDRFSLAAPFETDNYNPCSAAAVSILLTGGWGVQDSVGQPTAEIVIDSLGNLSGWDGYRLITVASDAAFDDTDEVMLGNDPNAPGVWFSADFLKDTVRLYQLDENPNGSPSGIRGNIRYTIVRNALAK